jgi:hypothetical protein
VGTADFNIMSAVPTMAGKLLVDTNPIALSASILATSLYSDV